MPPETPHLPTTVLQFDSYKTYLAHAFRAAPDCGRGLMTKIHRSTGIPMSTLSQVIKGEKNLVPEQAAALARFLELPPLASDYFLTLVELGRAGSPELRALLERRRLRLRAAEELPPGAAAAARRPGA